MTNNTFPCPLATYKELTMYIAVTRNESKSGIQQLRWQNRRALRLGGDPRPRPLCHSEAGTARFHRREGRSEGHRQEQARRSLESASLPGGERKIVAHILQIFLSIAYMPRMSANIFSSTHDPFQFDLSFFQQKWIKMSLC